MIKVEHLTKAFGPKLAVNDVSFTVERGEVLGFLGPNGAGKSTTMRMITGFHPADVGQHHGRRLRHRRQSAAGEAPDRLPARRTRPATRDMTVRGFLDFAAELRGLNGDAREAGRATARSRLCFLESVLYQTIDTLSKGYKHRTCLAQSIIHDPDMLILDEPTDGLDPEPEARSAQSHQAHGREQGDHFFDAHPRRSRSGVHARDHHRPRPDRRERHARRN